MADHAGERYLRLLLEQILAAGGVGTALAGPAKIQNAGAALAAVGAVDGDVVAQLRYDLALALALRRPSPDPAVLAAVPPADEARGETVAAVPRAVATGPNRFDTPEGVLVVESVSFGPDGATLVETLAARTDEAEPDPKRRRRGSTWPAALGDPTRPVPARRLRSRTDSGRTDSGPRSSGPGVPPRARPVGPGREQLRISDDAGREYRRGPATAGGGPAGWRWVSPLEPVPDPTTAWLELALGDSSYRLPVTAAGGIARGRPQRRSAGAAWLLGALQDAVAQALRADTAPRTDSVADGADALMALGLLSPTEALLDQLTLLAAYPDRAGELDPSLGSALAGRDRSTPAGRDGPALVGQDRTAADVPATLALATAVDLGSRSARLDVATLRRDGLRLSGWFSPWSADGGPDGASGWHVTGFDDRHNHYVATVDQRHRLPAGADVVWRLWPALDPTARSLRLRVAGPAVEASVEIVVE